MEKQRRVYSREFKQEAVRLVNEGSHSIAAIARDLGVDANSLRSWKREAEQHGAQSFPGQGRSHDEELVQLRREVALLRQERDILKKAVGYFAVAPRGDISLFSSIARVGQCGCSAESCEFIRAVIIAGFRAVKTAAVGSGSRRERQNCVLSAQIRLLFQEFKSRYGCPRLCRELHCRGVLANHKRVARLMREAGLKAKGRRRFKATTQSKHRYAMAPHLLERRFEVEGANRLWVSDITYIWTSEGWLYVAVAVAMAMAMVLDAWSRKIVGWAWSKALKADFAVRALTNALKNRRPQAGWMHHSDQGVQYAYKEYQEVLASNGAVVSMSRKGNCWDNALAESFFGTLKKELIHGESFKTREQAVSAIFEYIELFYNRQRRHSKLGYQSPAEYEEKNKNSPFRCSTKWG